MKTSIWKPAYHFRRIPEVKSTETRYIGYRTTKEAWTKDLAPGEAVREAGYYSELKTFDDRVTFASGVVVEDVKGGVSVSVPEEMGESYTLKGASLEVPGPEDRRKAIVLRMQHRFPGGGRIHITQTFTEQPAMFGQPPKEYLTVSTSEKKVGENAVGRSENFDFQSAANLSQLEVHDGAIRIGLPIPMPLIFGERAASGTPVSE